MKACSVDPRTKVVEYVGRGISKSETARRFGIDRSTGKRHGKRLDESGSLAPKRRLGKRPKLLWSGQVVVMDNLEAHKDRRVKELIETRGCELLDLPPYPPGLNRLSRRTRDFCARPGRVLGMLWRTRWV
jgi:transposase